MEMTIDPGSSGCAYALWRTFTVPCDPCKVVVWKPRTKDWMRNSMDAARDLAMVMRMNTVRAVHCEEPKYFNEGAASDGALVKLSFAVGCIGMAADLSAVPFKLVPVAKWMGQISETMLHRRVARRLGEDTCHELGLTTHGWDAVGIGLWLQGRFE